MALPRLVANRNGIPSNPRTFQLMRPNHCLLMCGTAARQVARLAIGYRTGCGRASFGGHPLNHS
jgi:hypothetical protein